MKASSLGKVLQHGGLNSLMTEFTDFAVLQ
jgi:hypothetical protein